MHAGASLGCVPRSRCPHVLAAASPFAGVGFEASRQADRAGEGPVAVRQARRVRQGIRPSRLPSDEQPGGPVLATARLPSVLHAASARHCGGGGTAVARLGVDPQLRPHVPLDGSRDSRVEEPCGTAPWEAVSPRVAPEPANLGLTRGLSQGSPKSVISRRTQLGLFSIHPLSGCERLPLTFKGEGSSLLTRGGCTTR